MERLIHWYIIVPKVKWNFSVIQSCFQEKIKFLADLLKFIPILKRTKKYILESDLTLEQLHSLTKDSVLFYREIGEQFVDAFAMLGVTEDVPAYVKVSFPTSGEIAFKSTSVMTRCGSSSVKVEKGSRYAINANDERFFTTCPTIYVPTTKD